LILAKDMTKTTEKIEIEYDVTDAKLLKIESTRQAGMIDICLANAFLQRK